MFRNFRRCMLLGLVLSNASLESSTSAAQFLHWNMNNPSSLEDSIGTNDLILPGGSSSPTFLPNGGYQGSGAYQFDGVNDNFQVTTSPTNLGPVNSDWTVNFWIKTTDSGTNSDNWGLQVPVFGEPGGGPIGFAIGIQSGRAGFMHYDGGWFKELGNANVADGVGHFLTFVHHDTGVGSGLMDIYVDGLLDKANINAHDVGPSAYNFSRIGNTYSGLFGNFTLDEVQFYNTALNADEVFDIAGTIPAPEPSSFLLLMSGMMGIKSLRRRRKI